VTVVGLHFWPVASGQPWSWISVTGQGPAKCKNGGRVLHLCTQSHRWPQCHNANDRVRQQDNHALSDDATHRIGQLLRPIPNFNVTCPPRKLGHGQGMGEAWARHGPNWSVAVLWRPWRGTCEVVWQMADAERLHGREKRAGWGLMRLGHASWPACSIIIALSASQWSASAQPVRAEEFSSRLDGPSNPPCLHTSVPPCLLLPPRPPPPPPAPPGSLRFASASHASLVTLVQ
jgi:hypothetical protein